MKILLALISAANLWFGLKAALNLLGLMQDAKYGTATTALVALLGFGLGAWGAYAAWTGAGVPRALVIGAAPWIIGVIAVVLSLLFSDPR